MERSPSYIRLFIATAAAVFSVAFVAAYSSLMPGIIRGTLHVKIQQFPLLTECLSEKSWYALMVPLCLLMYGVILLRRQRSQAGFEIVVGCQWLFALLWVLFCFLAWILPQAAYQEIIR